MDEIADHLHKLEQENAELCNREAKLKELLGSA
jgi:hypothetical protein